jgi:hypothetical protein
MAMNSRRNPLSALLDYANARGDEASSIGSVMTQLASPILKGQGVQVDNAVQRGPVPQPTLVEFNTTSKERLAGADPRLSDFMTEVERRASGQGINMQIAETNRSPERQEAMVASGKSQTLNSHHLTGNAADIYLVGPDGKPNYNFDDYKPVADIAKEVAAERGLTDFQWGGDWNTLKDGVHFQLGGAPNLNTTVSTMSAPNAGGALPQTVEGILSSLYPDSTEAEKTAHRKDIWRGLSQGLSALSQGRQVDLSNIAANADQRRRQYVLDTREKEKAKAAASLVYSQTGDASMAAGIASGAINYTDVLNERQMKRAEQAAQDARLKDAASTDALLTAMRAAKMPEATIKLVEEGGVDALDTFQKLQADQSVLEQEAKQQDIRDQNVADARFILSTAAPGSIQARAAERVIALGGEEDVFTLMKDRAPAADAQFTLGAGEVRYGPNGEVIATGPASAASDSSFTLGAGEVRYGPNGEVIATGPASSAATSGFTLGAGQARYDDQGNIIATGPAAPPNMQYALGPDGQVVLVPATAPAATGGAPAAGGAPAGTVGGAFGTMFGSVNDAAKAALLPGDIAQQTATLADTIAGTAATEQAMAIAAEAAPVELQNAKADLEAQLQENRLKAATESDEVAKAALDVEAANIANAQAALNLNIAQNSQSLDLEAKRLAVEKAKADAVAAQQAVTDAKRVADDKAAQRQVQATVSADTVMRYGKDILDMTSDWSDSVLAGGVNMVAGMIPRTEVAEVADRVNTIKNMTALDSLTAMRNASPTGAAVGNPSDAEGKRLEARYGALNVNGDPVKLREDIYAAMNAYLDTVYGTPEQIKKRYDDGKITGAIADAYSARYATRGAGVDPATAKVGSITTLGLTDTDMTVLGSLSGADSLMAPDTLTAEERAILDSLNAPAGGN